MWAWSAACWGAPSIFAVLTLTFGVVGAGVVVVLDEKKLVVAGAAAGVGVVLTKSPVDGAGVGAAAGV